MDLFEDGGDYQWPIDQITPRVDKEDLVKTVFQPDRMGGPEWLECVKIRAMSSPKPHKEIKVT